MNLPSANCIRSECRTSNARPYIHERQVGAHRRTSNARPYAQERQVARIGGRAMLVPTHKNGRWARGCAAIPNACQIEPNTDFL